MAAGLNQTVARQSKMSVKNPNTEQLKHTHINLAVLIRHSLKYKNAVSQKTFYRDTELQMSSKISKGGKEARLKGGGGGGGKGGKRGGLTDVSCHLQIPRRYGTFPWASRKGRPETMPAHTNTESQRQTHGQTNVGRQHSAGFFGPLSPLALQY